MRAPEFWRQNGFLPAILTPVSHVWAWWTNRRLVRSRPFHSGVPVICIGNVVAGGAGKTPVALDVMERLISRGIHAGFLSRGYGGKLSAPTHVNPASHSFRDVGDEPLLLAAVAPTWTGKDRSETARIAIQSGIQAFVMDDGLQNPTLQKDISILVVDGQQGLGNGRVIPAGPLREPLNRAIERVQAIVVIGKISESLNATLPDNMPVLQARFVPDMIDDDISGKPVVAFAGIGRPEKFFETLAGMGCDLVRMQSFPDHHYFSADEVMHLIDQAAADDALVVTTEKDMVRVPEGARAMVRSLKVRLEWDDSDALDNILSRNLTIDL